MSDGQLHALVEHADVGSLESFLVDEEVESPWLPWTLRTKLAADVAQGMTYLHSRGIFHRDLTSKVSFLRRGGWPLRQVVIAKGG